MNFALMNKISFRLKMSMLLLPLICIVTTLGGYVVYSEYRNSAESQKVFYSGEAFRATSKLIHEMQKERGRSALFINKKITQDEFLTQQKKVDSAIMELQLKISPVLFSDKDKYIADFQALLKENREQINNEKIPAPILKKYTAIINLLIKLESDVFENATYQGKGSKIKSLILLDAAKESMGRLRAELNNTFATNVKRESIDRDRVIETLTLIPNSLNSPLLVMSVANKEKIVGILQSDSWKDVLASIHVFTEKYNVGNYGIDAKQFFDKITSQIDAIFNIMDNQLKENLDELNRIHEKTELIFISLGLFLTALILLIILFSHKILSNIVVQFNSIAKVLKEASGKVERDSIQVASSSEELSQATHEQAASLQESSSSIEEISSMINTTKDHAKASVLLSREGVKMASEGVEIVGKMVHTINAISASNNELIVQMTNFQKETDKILDVIRDIENKTQVINEIVFQTKLLSFNASVESARAGEHGKGFAVVAEEVGKLAQMSGNASTEISELLSKSTNAVKDMIANSQEHMRPVIHKNEEIISQGLKVAHDCEASFVQINNSISSIADTIEAISRASEEQGRGVDEMSKAIAQLDQVSQQNAISSANLSHVAESLSSQVNTVGESSTVLWEAIEGVK